MKKINLILTVIAILAIASYLTAFYSLVTISFTISFVISAFVVMVSADEVKARRQQSENSKSNLSLGDTIGIGLIVGVVAMVVGGMITGAVIGSSEVGTYILFNFIGAVAGGVISFNTYANERANGPIVKSC